MTLHLRAVGGLPCASQTAFELFEPFAYPFRKPLTNGFVLLLAIHGPAKDKGLSGVRASAKLYLDVFADIFPAATLYDLAFPVLELAFRRTDDILSAA